MKIRHIISTSVLVLFVAGLLSFFLISKPAAQTKDVFTKSTAGPVRTADADPSAAPTPRMSDGHPNLTGFWAGGAPPEEDPVATDVSKNPNATVHELTRTADGSTFYSYAGANAAFAVEDGTVGDGSNIKIAAPYKPEYAAKVQKIIDAQFGIVNYYDPNLDCKPEGVPRAGFGGFVVSDPSAVAIMYEASPGPYYRIIYTDGRPHPTDIDTSYMGNSIGHWEGDTLVVDTTALDDTTWLMSPGASLHSDKEHVVEHWTRKGNQVTTQTTVEDPVMFTKPWVMPARKIALTDGDPSLYGNYILPAMCNTNDKSHLVVKAVTGNPKDVYVCNWCNKESVYGGDPNKLTVPKDARVKGNGE
jgi:hypothetical protein